MQNAMKKAVTSGVRAINATADRSGDRDAADALDAATADPLPGDHDIAQQLRIELRNLSQACDADEAAAVRANNQSRAQIERHKNHEPVHPSAEFPKRDRIIAWEYVPVVVLGAIEAAALRPAIATILGFDRDAIEVVSIAVTLAALAAVFAHLAAAARVEVTARTTTAEQRRRATLNSFGHATGLLSIIGIAVLARVYEASLLAQLGELGLDPAGVGFFIGFQAAFGLGALALAHHHARRVNDADERHAIDWIDQCKTDIEDNDRFLTTISDRHEEHQTALTDGAQDARRQYRARLVDRQEDFVLQQQWRERLNGPMTAESADGAHADDNVVIDLIAPEVDTDHGTALDDDRDDADLLDAITNPQDPS